MSLCALAEERSRRVRLIEISTELILELLKVPEGGIVVDGDLITVESNPIPMDAKVVGVNVSRNRRKSICLQIESTEFEELQEGASIPFMTPFYHSERIRDD